MSQLTPDDHKYIIQTELATLIIYNYMSVVMDDLALSDHRESRYISISRVLYKCLRATCVISDLYNSTQSRVYSGHHVGSRVLIGSLIYLLVSVQSV